MAALKQFWRSLRSSPYLKLIPAVVGVLLVFAVITSGASTRESTETQDNNCAYHPEAYEGLNPAALEGELTSTGLIGRIHGAAPEAQLYVLSVREPNNFFAHTEYSLIPRDEDIPSFQQLSRHDLVCVQGKVQQNPSPQTHIAVEGIQTLDTWSGLDNYPPYQHEQGIPDELKAGDRFVGKVHAIGDEGKVLVVEYKDAVLPVFVRSGDVTKDLYRGDIVRLAYRIQSWPDRPPHLQLDPTADTPIEVISSIASWDGQTKTLSGQLVKFPRSPQIKLDVYAIAVQTEGVKRYFTLVNFQDMDQFQAILDKLAAIWEDNQNAAVNGRNVLIEPNVTIEATGQINMISAEQANPQILLSSLNELRQLQ